MLVLLLLLLLGESDSGGSGIGSTIQQCRRVGAGWVVLLPLLVRCIVS
jgi:hypothetical protein